MLDDVDEFRPDSLKAVHDAVLGLGREAPYVFAVTNWEGLVSRLPQWIQDLPRR